MVLDDAAVSAASRSGKKQIRPAESSAPQRLIDSSTGSFPTWFLPGRSLPVIGKHSADIPPERCERK
jgi:hypothetical protein